MTYLARLVDRHLDELLVDLPAVLLVGPRGCGKTTTAERRAHGTLWLARRAVAAAVEADPDAALAGLDRPTLIDEWQIVPDILGAVKRAVDDGAEPGSFLITGSVRADLTAAGWPMTARVVRVPMWGLTGRETRGAVDAPSFFDRLLDAPHALRPAAPVLDVRDYVDLALASGFPRLVRSTSDRSRRAFLASYVDELVLRDVALAGADREPIRLRRYLRAVAASSAGTPDLKTLVDAAGIDRRTASAYDDLLELLVVTERVPAWTSNRLSRLVRLPKRYVIEPALLGPLLGILLHVLQIC